MFFYLFFIFWWWSTTKVFIIKYRLLNVAFYSVYQKTIVLICRKRKN